jgi:putative addiction module killer protein
LERRSNATRSLESRTVDPTAVFASAYLVGYTGSVIEIRQTDEYMDWFEGLRDREARSRILVRIRRVSLGNLGDIKPVGEGVSELRVDCGPGYRIYLKQQGDTLVILLAGGDKSSQKRDVERAKRLAREL